MGKCIYDAKIFSKIVIIVVKLEGACKIELNLLLLGSVLMVLVVIVRVVVRVPH